MAVVLCSPIASTRREEWDGEADKTLVAKATPKPR